MKRKTNNFSYLSDTPDIPMIKTKYEKRGKSWVKVDAEKELVSEQFHARATNTDTLKFFRNLGGYERNKSTYTNRGYKVYKNTSISPDRSTKYVREYDFLNNIRGK